MPGSRKETGINKKTLKTQKGCSFVRDQAAWAQTMIHRKNAVFKNRSGKKRRVNQKKKTVPQKKETTQRAATVVLKKSNG